MKKCLYCGKKLDDNGAFDVCRECGIKVWGVRMFDAIKQNMEDADEKGNLKFNDPLEMKNNSNEFRTF